MGPSSVDESVNRIVAFDEEVDQLHAGVGVLKVQLVSFGFTVKLLDEIVRVCALKCECNLYIIGNEMADYSRTNPPGASRY